MGVGVGVGVEVGVTLGFGVGGAVGTGLGLGTPPPPGGAGKAGIPPLVLQAETAAHSATALIAANRSLKNCAMAHTGY